MDDTHGQATGHLVIQVRVVDIEDRDEDIGGPRTVESHEVLLEGPSVSDDRISEAVLPLVDSLMRSSLWEYDIVISLKEWRRG